jgi:hypothetical protein
VQGDTAPAIRGQILYEATNAPLNVTGSAVRFQMRKSDDRRFTVNALASVVDGAAGQVSYAWAANDLAVPGEYLVQWEVTFPTLRVQTTATSTITVRRQ